ncbi:MAG: hypothetical protein LC802_20575 [Acidobacteria bacterium]|nr:hypothetical protein [Acidobacteriota bacterium]
MNVLIGCLMVGALLGACGGGADNANTTGNTNVARNSNAASATNTNAATNASSSTTAAVPSADKIGVPECDDYIAKYEACINSKVPEATRATYKNAFDASRKAWRDAAATPAGKSSLAQACKTAHETAKASLASFGCSW